MEKGNKRKVKKHPTFGYSFKASLPVMAGYIILGMGFGIMLHNKGYAWWWATLMSVTIYAGSMQYVAVDLLSSGATVLSTALITLTVNVRHLFYGLSVLEKYKGTGIKKPYLIFALTDETYSLVCGSKPPENIDEKNIIFMFRSLIRRIG